MPRGCSWPRFLRVFNLGIFCFALASFGQSGAALTNGPYVARSWFQFPDWKRFVFEQLAHHEACVLVEMWEFSKFPRTDGLYVLPRGLNRPLNQVMGEWTKCDPYVRGRLESSPIHRFSMVEEDASSGRTRFRLIVRYNADTNEPLCLDLFDAGGEHGTKVGQLLVDSKTTRPQSWLSSARSVWVRSTSGETVAVPDGTVLCGCVRPRERFRKAYEEYYPADKAQTFKVKFTYTFLHRNVMNWIRSENYEPELAPQGVWVSVSRRFRKIAHKFTWFSFGFFAGRINFSKLAQFDPKKAAMALVSDIIHNKITKTAKR